MEGEFLFIIRVVEYNRTGYEMKKPKKKAIIKRLQNTADRLWYAYCKKRDGVCQIGKWFPAHCKRDMVTQVHHIFSDSKHHNICYDVENGITLCLSCHAAISFGDDVRKELIRKIVDKDIYERLLEQALIPGPHLCWRNIEWLENQISILESMQ